MVTRAHFTADAAEFRRLMGLAHWWSEEGPTGEFRIVDAFRKLVHVYAMASSTEIAAGTSDDDTREMDITMGAISIEYEIRRAHVSGIPRDKAVRS